MEAVSNAPGPFGPSRTVWAAVWVLVAATLMSCQPSVGIPEQGGAIYIENRTGSGVVARFREGAFERYFQADPGGPRWVLFVSAGTNGVIDILDDECLAIVRNLATDSARVNVVVLEADSSAVVEHRDRWIEEAASTTELPTDRCP